MIIEIRIVLKGWNQSLTNRSSMQQIQLLFSLGKISFLEIRMRLFILLFGYELNLLHFICGTDLCMHKCGLDI